MPKNSLNRLSALVVCLTFLYLTGQSTLGQTYGIELHNSVMPASAGMGGASFSRPQDIQSAINGNPATTTQYGGTVFSFGGAFIEPTYNVTQTLALPLLTITPYSAKSDTPASLLGNIAVTHQTTMMGVPVTMGMAFLSNAGLGVDFRPVTDSNGTHASYVALDLVNSFAVDLTPQLSVGATVGLGTSFLDGPFVGSSSTQSDYAPRFSVGANYDMGNGTSVGAFWQSKKNHDFDNAVRIGGVFQDVALDHPANFGFGIANRCLMNGRLLLAADALFKNYDEADFFQSIYHDQWAFQFGGQYQVNHRLKVRMGYAYNEDPTRDSVPGTIGGVIPVGGIPAVQYIQGQFAAIGQHRLTGGVGIREFMPGVDLDLALGGAFDGTKSFGATTASVDGYWLAFGFTWRRGANSPECCTTPIATGPEN